MLRRFSIILCLLAVAILAGCQSTPAPQTALPEVQYYTLRFWDGDTLLYSEDLEKGTMPQPKVPDFPGCAFYGWEETLVPVTENADYHAILAPTLLNHVPYLFPREDGLLHADDPMTGEDMKAALFALSDGESHIPALPAGDLTENAFYGILAKLFPSEPVPATRKEDTISRAEAARVLNRYLGRQEEPVSLAAEGSPILDLSPLDSRYADLMEAAMLHSKGTEPWDTILPDTGYAPGWHIADGKAAYFDEYGYLVTNAALPGGQMLNSCGIATTGDAGLDSLVQTLLAEFQAADPEADRLDLLTCAYDYVRDSFTYVPMELLAYGATGWETDFALEMLTTGRGNCYYYAAAFSALAKGLGYNAWAVSGKLLYDNFTGCEPHGWVEIQIGDDIFYFDPESEMASLAHGIPCRLFMRGEKNTKNILYMEKGSESPHFIYYYWWNDL